MRPGWYWIFFRPWRMTWTRWAKLAVARLARPPRLSTDHPRPGLLLPHLHRAVVALDRPARADLAGPAAAAQQVPDPRDGVLLPEPRRDQVADAGQGPPLVFPPGRQRPGVQHRIQRSQLVLIQPALRRLPARGQPGQASCLPGLPPPPHRPLTDPQLRGDHRGRRLLLESPRRLQPDLLPASSAPGGQPAALRIPHTPCIPPEAPRVSPADITN
jgi:hypothetical protein